MEIRERLERCRTLRRETQELRDRLEELREDMIRCTSHPPDGMPRASRRGPDRIADALGKLEALAERLALRILEQERELQTVEALLEFLPPVQRRIMQLRYIQGLDWEQVALEEHYSERHCRRIHDEAARRLDAMPESNSRMSDNVR